MIESSITEEIKEENYSEKTSSDNKSSNDVSASRAALLDDHVIVREGITSIFQHNASPHLDTEDSADAKSPNNLGRTISD